MTNGWAQRKNTSQRTSSAVSMKSASEGAISMVFVSAPDGAALTGGNSGQRSLNLGTVSNAGGTQTTNVQMQKLPGRFVVSTKFGMSIQAGSQTATTAAVLAALTISDPAYTFRLDGVTLQ